MLKCSLCNKYVCCIMYSFKKLQISDNAQIEILRIKMKVFRRTLQCFPLNLTNLGAPCFLKCSVGSNRSWANTRFNSVSSFTDDDIEKIAASKFLTL